MSIGGWRHYRHLLSVYPRPGGQMADHTDHSRSRRPAAQPEERHALDPEEPVCRPDRSLRLRQVHPRLRHPAQGGAAPVPGIARHGPLWAWRSRRWTSSPGFPRRSAWTSISATTARAQRSARPPTSIPTCACSSLAWATAPAPPAEKMFRPLRRADADWESDADASGR